MKQTITKSMFRDAFVHMGRKDSFSYEGLGALFDYLEECCEDFELDVIALCCDYSEDTIENVLKSYNLESIEELEDETSVVWKDEKNVLFACY